MEGQGWLCGEVGRRQTGAGVSWVVGESVVADRGDIGILPACLCHFQQGGEVAART